MRITAAPTVTEPLAPPRRLRLGLSELVLAARLAGDVPLPLRVADHPAPDRFTERLAGTPVTLAHEQLAEELARRRRRRSRRSPCLAGRARRGRRVRRARPGRRRDPPEPRGRAAVGRARRGRRPEVGRRAAAVVERRTPRAGHPAADRVRARGRARLVRPAAVGLPAHACRDGRAVGARAGPAARCPTTCRCRASCSWATSRPIATSAPTCCRRSPRATSGGSGSASPARCAHADSDEIGALLATLGGACRGRLRLLTGRRDRPADPPAVTTWLMFDDGWHELRPGRDATSVLRRRDARDLGLLTWPLVEGVPS